MRKLTDEGQDEEENLVDSSVRCPVKQHECRLYELYRSKWYVFHLYCGNKRTNVGCSAADCLEAYSETTTWIEPKCSKIPLLDYKPFIIYSLIHKPFKNMKPTHLKIANFFHLSKNVSANLLIICSLMFLVNSQFVWF